MQQWFGKGFWAVTDQGLFAGTNFVVSVILVRWLPPADYGAYALAFSIFLLLAGVHNALVAEPMVVYGAGKYHDAFPQYLGSVVRGHWLIALMIGGLLAIAASACWAVSQPGLASALLGLAFASIFILYQYLMRRVPYIAGQPRHAAIAGMVFAVVTGLYLWAAYAGGLLTAFMAFIVTGIASLVAALCIARRYPGQSAWPVGSNEAEVTRDHWQYGKWVIGVTLMSWLPTNVVLFVLPIKGGLEAAGVYRALMNLVLPMNNLVTAFGMLLLPYFVRARKAGSLRVPLAAATAILGTVAVGYGLMLLLMGEPLLVWLYGPRYTSVAALLPLLAPVPLATTFAAVLSGALRACERPAAIFWSYAGASVFAVTVGAGIVYAFALAGALVYTILTALVTAVAMGVLCFRLCFAPRNVASVQDARTS